MTLCLIGATTSSLDVMTLVECKDVDIAEIQSVQDCQRAAGNQDTVDALETLVKTWCAQIEQVFQRPVASS